MNIAQGTEMSLERERTSPPKQLKGVQSYVHHTEAARLKRGWQPSAGSRWGNGVGPKPRTGGNLKERERKVQPWSLPDRNHEVKIDTGWEV